MPYLNGFCDLFWPRVTLTFDLLTTKVDRLMSLPRGVFVPSRIKIGSFLFKISFSQVW